MLESPILYAAILTVIGFLQCPPAYCTVAALLVSFLHSNLGAADTRLPLAVEFSAGLGWTLDEALSWLGPPASMFPFRGDVAEEDNVVFFYPDSRYLFWFNDRVWQLRADENWKGEVDGVAMGMKRSQIDRLWGAPINDWDENPTWTLPDRGYPVRIRLYFDDNDRLVDLYVYRSDW